MAENNEITQEIRQRLETFDPKAPLIINCAEIEGLEDYVGRIVFRRPNNGDRIKIGVLTSKLTEGAALDSYASNLAYAIATFKTLCAEKPKELDWEDLEEATPIFLLFERYLNWQELFRYRIQLNQERLSQKK